MAFGDLHGELRRHRAAGAVEFFYRLFKANKRRVLAKYFLKILFKLEGGQYRSFTARKLMSRDHHVDIGVHSYGELFTPGEFAPSVKVGKYCSIGKAVRVFTQNHPTNEVSTHPYFYEAQFGVIEQDALVPAVTEIGHDVWIGHAAILLPGCKQVGNGAIIGAGAIVTKDVPPYAIVAGNPAKLIKYRFDEATITRLEAMCWWDKPFEELNSLTLK